MRTTIRFRGLSEMGCVKRKKEGGLGIKEMGKFNRARVGKWVWRILREKEKLWVRVLELKYGRL
ncbi:hypothetical protein ACS0TY_003613 [Phlomoides rotata]